MADDKPSALDGVPLDRREFVQRLLRSSAFAVPVALGLSTLAAREACAEDASASASAGTGGAAQSGAVQVAEPASVALLGLGAAAAALAARQRADATDDTD
ncbi:MAG: PEP-CTERM sorting domain-containing protein [Gammaproteobacteria bacterium]